MHARAMDDLLAAFGTGALVPYLGPGVLDLAGEDCPLPNSPETLVGRLTAKATTPHKIRNNLTAAAQYIENFKHRKTVAAAMAEAFAPEVDATALHRWLAERLALPLIVHAWYDDLPQRALAGRTNWGAAQAVSPAEHFGAWTHFFDADGEKAAPEPASTPGAAWTTLLYQPLGSVSPAKNFLVSDSDFVEVLTEIDIQTPIPERVQQLRSGRSFLFLGCRFAHQLERIFARQIMKRSSDRHWAVLPQEPTRNEAKFLKEHNIERIDLPLAEFVSRLIGASPPALAAE